MITADHPTEARSGSRMFSEGVCSEVGNQWDIGCPLFSCVNQRTEYAPGQTSAVLAFDIETTGLSESDSVTCVCAYDAARGIDFRACTPRGEICEEFMKLLDEAPLLCAFNGVLFDLKFLAKRWNIDFKRVAGWVLKLLDPYQACKLALKRTFSLDRLLEANGVECKTGSGKEAVEMAKDGRWAELENYCMNDTMKTHDVVKLGCLKLPDVVPKNIYTKK